MLPHVLEPPHLLAFAALLAVTNIRECLLLSSSTKEALWWHKAKQIGKMFPQPYRGQAFPMPTSKMMFDQLMFGASEKNFWKGKCTAASFSNSYQRKVLLFIVSLLLSVWQGRAKPRVLALPRIVVGKPLQGTGMFHYSAWNNSGLYSLLKMRLFHISQKFCASFSFCHCSFVSSALAEDPQDQNF